MQPHTAVLKLFASSWRCTPRPRTLLRGSTPSSVSLLDACGAANVDVVRFILTAMTLQRITYLSGRIDLRQRDDSGDTPILAAAGSLICLAKDIDEEDKTEWIQDRISRAHQLMHLSS